jgi:alkaline phosphatase D
MAHPQRRLLIRRALLAAMAGLSTAGHAPRARSSGRWPADPFALGVASGCPEPESVVLWTRLAPDPRSASGGLDPLPVAVRWEVAEDDRFARVVRSGTATASPERAHAVHVEADGLRPGRWYWYRFHAGDGAQAATSPVGRTRTAPAADAAPGALRLAFASCQHWERGYYAAWRHLADEAPELVLHLGDYIYEGSVQRGAVRQHWTPEPTTLDGYRVRLAQYRTDADLQRAHAIAPWLVTWDDHEVDNDYADDRSEDLDPDFLARRAAAYRAYFEHMPLRGLAAPEGPRMRLHGEWGWGTLARLFVLDCRQYRSHQACPWPGRGGSNTVDAADCAALFDEGRSMLGTAQEQWLARGLRASGARWNLLAQSTLLARFDSKPGPGERFWTDGWSGYPAAAQRLTDALATSRARNPLVIGGDVHTHYVADVKARWDDPASATVATEFCGTSITSPSMPQARIDATLPENPHIRLGDGRRRGYVVIELGEQRAQVHLRVIEDARDPATPKSTLASFVVEDGRAGAQKL